MRRNDTIVAISTPAGVGGIAVLRLSGPDALAMACRHLSASDLKPRHATYCRFDDLDDIVATYFPQGYTGEATVELSCHGSRYVQQTMLQVLVDSGARLADPGEFTMRAFIGGRMNLSQAEAVADLIEAATSAQHRLAVSQLRGGYAHELERLRQEMLDLASLLELELDFSEEDLEFADRKKLNNAVEELSLKVRRLIDSFQNGNALKNGVPVAIVGRPNSGKSTLLNALLNDDRAMVSDMPGTTRDTIEETMTVGGVTFRFIDTAGLRSSDDPLETMGIERTYKAAKNARIILFLHDVQRPASEAKKDLEELGRQCDISTKTIIVIHTKCDLGEPDSSDGMMIAAKEGKGIDELKQMLADTVRETMAADDDVMLTNARHYKELTDVQGALEKVKLGLANQTPADLMAVDLRDALYHLGAITGEVTSNDLLTNIFSRFCVGK